MTGRRLEGRVAVVTGSARGIGAAVSRRLAADGASVIVHYLSRREAAESLVDELRAGGGRATAVGANLTDREETAGIFRAADAWGRLDVLVNNAGVSEFVPLVEIADGQVEQHFNLNFRGALWCMQEAARRMGEGGRIINISTLGTSSPLRTQCLYSASKAAMEQLTLQGAAEFADLGITVNTVSPGSTQTELFWESVPPELHASLAARSHFGGLGQPEDIAGAVAFLASDEARWVTGQRIVVSGGAW